MPNARSGPVHTSDGTSAYEFSIKAPAKVNLSLHINGRRLDGYHELTGLVAFADIADELHFKQEGHPDVTGSGMGWSLDLAGPFAVDLCEASKDQQNNLVVEAARLYQKEEEGCPGGEILLEKNLPIAAGIGGGSSDAAATLRALQEFCENFFDEEDLRDMADDLGADVPMCLVPEAKIIAGTGNIYKSVPGFQPLPAVLVNPRVGVSTALVFKELAAPAISAVLPPELAWKDILLEFLHPLEANEVFKRMGDTSPLSMIEWLRAQRNDLQKPAIRLAPIIGDVLAAIDKNKNCQLARMSGSGATCFGLYKNMDYARAAAHKISTDHPDWWVADTMLG